MSSKIRILDEQTINKIAAGEVIENPASVVKELVDNAIDAGASKIVIEAEGSGRQSISVIDNGSGMSMDDALLCLERIATSKIRSADDLWGLSTMGFRGEALAAIGAVSEISILTALNQKSANELQEGTSVVASGGKVLSCRKTETFGGTHVQVKSLFHNVPARRKFQKSPARDESEIVKIVSLLALGHPNIAFELIINKKKILNLAGCISGNYMARLQEICGNDFASQLIEAEFVGERLSLSGYIGKPTAVRSSRSGQYLFVNKRPVESLLISKAIAEAYGASIADGKFPIFALHVEIAPDCVDVNVHPQKKQVRFMLEEEIRSGCRKMILQKLFTSPLGSFSPPPQVYDLRPDAIQTMHTYTLQQKPLQSVQVPLFETVAPSFRIIGTIWNYIFVEFSEQERLCVIDVKRALSRITHEALLAKPEQPKPLQPLLVPLFIEFSATDALLLVERLPAFQQLGVNIYEFGTRTFIVDAISAAFEHVDIEMWIRASLAESEPMDKMSVLAAELCKPRACCSEAEAQQLVKKLLACKEPAISASGTVTMVYIEREEFAKKFREVL